MHNNNNKNSRKSASLLLYLLAKRAQILLRDNRRKAKNIILLLLLFTLGAIGNIMVSCKLNKNVKKKYLEGTYCTDKIPSDTGGFYRNCLRFKDDGTVISMASSLECDSTNKSIHKNYAEIGRYTIIKNDSIKFTFINNRINQNEYKAIYRGIRVNNTELKFVITVQYKGGKPYRLTSTYFHCQ